MPKVLGLLGRLPRLGPRRISFILVAISLLAVVSLVFTLPGGLPDGPSLSRYAEQHKFTVPTLPDLKKIKNPFSREGALNPFRQPSHAPPRQRNDTFEESSWWADWKWLVPFSSSLTLDEDRSLLPPLAERPAVYCYYDETAKRDSATKDAESELLLTWRMAWWAKGFKPVILSAAEAMNNPQYDVLQRVEVDPVVKTELMRWLAFETMGGGLMSHYTLLPMGPYEDPLLSFLRRGEYPTLTKWQDLGAGFFVGSKELVASVTESMCRDADELKKAHDAFALIGESTFYTEASPPKALAYYDAARLEADYPKIAEEMSKDRPKALHTLNKLMNAHLHVMWQNVFGDGVAVLKPHAKHTTPLVADAWELAHLLAECPDSPAPESCPPNYPTCSRCEPGRVKISTPEQYSNASTLFTIGTVPHPYTLATLSNMRDKIDVAWIRRKMSRDPWVTAVMADAPGSETGGGSHVTRVKAAIAGEPSSPAHSIWLTAEKEPPGDLHWYFGFTLPANSTALEKEAEKEDGTDAEAVREQDILNKALKVSASGEEAETRVWGAAEAWNLADAEAWRFARAFLARRTVERMGWEEEERRYIDGAGSEEGRHRWNRWMDKIGDRLV